MHEPLLICDLDGTLVDSQPGIVEALRQACLATGVEPLQTLAELPVGPPLDELLRSVTGLQTGETLHRLRSAFTDFYDSGACRLTIPFEGVQTMLESLRVQGVALAIATNKRQAPTTSILEALGWTHLFVAVESVDSRPPSGRTKAQMLQGILAALAPPAAAYLGDTAADIDAAREAVLPCIVAEWGYGRHLPPAAPLRAASPREAMAACLTTLQSSEWQETIRVTAAAARTTGDDPPPHCF